MKKRRKPKEPTMPYGKFAGISLRQILKAEPSYLAWFEQTVEGEDELKAVIRALPQFPEILVAYLRKKCRKAQAQVVEPLMPVDRVDLDTLCDRLFHGPAD